MHGKNVFIAGGAGLVGTSLIKRLHNSGAQVRASYFSRVPSIFKNLYSRFDFTQEQDCIEATQGVDILLMCAAQTSGIKKLRQDPTAAILPNLKINAGLLEASRINKVKKVIFISSSTVYQPANYLIREEELDLNEPMYDAYLGIGWVNRYIEQLIFFYRKSYDMKIDILRPTNIYGPHDHFDDNKSHVLPALVKRALNKENPFVVWGDGETVRDFIYVEDIIDILVTMIGAPYDNILLNVGSGVETKIKDLVKIILDQCFHGVVPQYDTNRPAAISYRMLNIDKLNSFMKSFNPTPLYKGLQETILWYQSVA